MNPEEIEVTDYTDMSLEEQIEINVNELKRDKGI